MQDWLYLLWASSPVCQLVIAGIMFRRRLHREFPIFLSYTLFRALTALLGMSRGHLLTEAQYFDLAWLHETGCMLLRFAVIYELYRVLFKPYSDLQTASIYLYRWGTAILLLVSVIIAVSLRGNPPNGWMNAGLNILDRTVDIVQVGLLLIVLASVRYLRLSWRSYSFGIAVGLGIFAAVDLITSAVLAQSGSFPDAQQRHLVGIMDLTNLATYQVCTLIWLVYALLPERVPNITTNGSDGLPYDPGVIPENNLDAWNDELERLLQR